jgi:hypothetical protein
MKSKIFLLSSIVFIHSIFSISCILFIIMYSFKIKTNILLEYTVFLVILSFLVYKKCILIDIYDYIKNLGPELVLPDIAKDNYIRKKINNLLNLKNNIKENNIDYTEFRLDILNNIDSLFKQNNKIIFNSMINHKIHYLIANIIIIVIYLHKYNVLHVLPVFITWILKIYPL